MAAKMRSHSSSSPNKVLKNRKIAFKSRVHQTIYIINRQTLNIVFFITIDILILTDKRRTFTIPIAGADNLNIIINA